jgi:pyruvate formate lyase activating enzyme
MPIRGVEWTSLVDYPGQICTTLFFGGCNFRCGFCHNTPLVLAPARLSLIERGQLLAKLKERSELVPAICLTGGEPTLDPGLPTFIADLKKLGLMVKLDTNGTQPQILASLLADGLLDYVAMDIKGPKKKYSQIAGVPVDTNTIQDSIDLLKRAAPAYEFRTTVVPGFLNAADIVTVGQELAGAKKYVLQQFRPAHPLLDPKLEQQPPYSNDFLYQIAAPLTAYVDTVEVRC